MTACGPAGLLARWFAPDPRLGEWIADLGFIFDAILQRGLGAAVEEHQLVLSARIASSSNVIPEDERADRCGAIAAAAGEYFQRTGAVWVLPAAVAAGEAAYRLTSDTHPDRAK